MSKQNENEFNRNCLNDKLKIPKKIWKKEYNPLREFILWGWDNNNNPSFLILYAEHQFKNKTVSDNNILEDDVKYTSYAIFRGHEGHLPSFQAVEIIYTSYYNRKLDYSSTMYYKNSRSYYWDKDEDHKIKDFKNLNSEEQIVLPYFAGLSYSEYIEQIEIQNINFTDFKLAKHPNEILKLEGALSNYYEVIYDMMNNPNIYMRKKRLKELININPPKEIYDLLLNIGSTELISGLFLELAKLENPILIKEAQIIISSDIKWSEDSYIEGMKRCIHIYLNVLNEDLKQNRIEWIYKHLSEMDLHLIHINNKDIPSDKILEGFNYRKYAQQGFFTDYYTKHRCAKRYKVGAYTDGTALKTTVLKNTIQEAETYGLADVIGKIAYYLDAPRLNYYFIGSGKSKELKYFRAYIRRTIDFYAKNEPDKFMQAMKSLLTSYTEFDYLCKFRGNFQFNKFIKQYLYYDFKEKAPENWYKRCEWLENDQLLKLEGRYEFMKEVWDTHIEDVLYIAGHSKINTISKACYYILKDFINNNNFIETISYKQLVELTQSSYEPLSNMFMDILLDKLNQLNIFDPNLMLALISSQNSNMHKFAIEFFRRTNGSFEVSNIIDLMFIDNFNEWIDLFKEILLSLDGNKYMEFIKAFINNSDRFINFNIDFSKEVKDLFSLSTITVQNISIYEKTELICYIIDRLFDNNQIPEYISLFIEELIFSLEYKELELILKEINIDFKEKRISQKNKQIISLLEAIKSKNLPSDVQIINILETGTSRMVKILLDMILENSEVLNSRFSTLLIMFESDITVLNRKAEEIFCEMNKEKQQKLHSLIIDSPVNRVYLYGLTKLDEIYGELLPESFILQMLEHTSFEVKAYISDKINKILDNLEDRNKEIFMYYVKAVLFLPNKISKSKDSIYKAIPKFALRYKDKSDELENTLLDIGGSNIIKDSELALITLAQIRKEAI